MRIIDNIFNFNAAYAPLMISFAVLDIMDIFLLVIGLVYTVWMLTIMSIIVRKARILDRRYI
jgi:hypothetical protein